MWHVRSLKVMFSSAHTDSDAFYILTIILHHFAALLTAEGIYFLLSRRVRPSAAKGQEVTVDNVFPHCVAIFSCVCVIC